jgi:ubiquitin carboxyl-terminal hydrolase 1
MNNHQDWAYNSPSPYRPAPSPPLKTEQIISTLALLTLGYYILNFLDIWPSTIKRASFEFFIWLIPNRLIYASEHLMHRLGRLHYDVPLFKRGDFGNQQAKISALQRLIGDTNSPVRGAMRRASTLSGLNNVFRSTEVRGPPGLGNWDNSCYQNSVLQGFASLPAFGASIQRMSEKLQRAGDVSPTHEALEVFLAMLNEFSDTRRVIWTPAILKSMDSWQQQDAQEYFSRVLDEVDKEVVKHQKRQMDKPGLENIRKRKFEEFAKPSPYVPVTTIRHDLETAVETSVPAPSHAMGASEEQQATSTDEWRMPEPATAFRNPLDGMLAQRLGCLTCGFTEGLSFIQFNCLTVNLGDGSGTVAELLDEYTAPEEIEGVECSNCTKMAHEKAQAEDKIQLPSADADPAITKTRLKPVLRTKSKQITVGRLPTDLVIHINRSIFDMYGNQRKNTSMVGFPLKLEFLNRWCAPIDSSEAVQRTYELRCAVTHYGRHENGHYIAYGKRDKDWYCFNDELVTKVGLEEVLGAGNVFMLFYEAIEEISAPEDPVGPVVLETVAMDEPSSASRSPSSSEGSETVEGLLSAVAEQEITVPVMRTAPPSSPLHCHSDRLSSSIVEAL